MFSSATQPPPRHNFVVSAITFEGFKLHSSNLTRITHPNILDKFDNCIPRTKYVRGILWFSGRYAAASAFHRLRDNLKNPYRIAAIFRLMPKGINILVLYCLFLSLSLSLSLSLFLSF